MMLMRHRGRAKRLAAYREFVILLVVHRGSVFAFGCSKYVMCDHLDTRGDVTLA